MSIYVGNLAFDVTATEINSAVSDYGTIKSINILSDCATRGGEEDSAIAALNNVELIERGLKVNKARPKDHHQEKL
jgi:RNA recognition motif-containing protein